MGSLVRAALVVVLALGVVACAPAAAPGASAAAGESANDVLQRALAAHTAGRTDEAIVLYYQTLAKDPNNNYAFFNLGVIAHGKNQLVAAESWYRLALENDKKMTSALYNLALVREVRGDPTESATLLRSLIAIDPNNASAHWNLGVALRALGQTDAANAEFAAAQKLDARLAPPPVNTTPHPSPTR